MKSKRTPQPDTGAGAEGEPGSGASGVLDRLGAERRRLVLDGEDTSEVDAQIISGRREVRDASGARAGTLLHRGRFELVEKVGRGGFGTVWKAFDHEKQDAAAVKLLHPQYSEDKTVLKRFFRGAQKMASLSHPGIVHVLLERGTAEELNYYAMEFFHGGDLRQCALAERWSESRIRQTLAKVAEALHFAHGHGLVHRDVTPGNILLDKRGRPKLTDFDLVRAPDTTGGTRTGALGTFLYAAPESMQDAANVDARADIYSLGMVGIFMVLGQNLPLSVLRDFDGTVAQLNCSKHLKRLLSRACNFQPENRFGSALEFSRALSEEPTEHQLTPDPPEAQPSEKGTGSLSPAGAARVTLPSAATPQRPQLFVSYAHSDELLVKPFREQLKGLEHTLGIRWWDDTKIAPGEDWFDEISRSASDARAVVLMLSPAFLASDFIHREELTEILRNRVLGRNKIFPVHVRPSVWRSHAELARIQAVNDPKNPLCDLSNAERGHFWVHLSETLTDHLVGTEPRDSAERQLALELVEFMRVYHLRAENLGRAFRRLVDYSLTDEALHDDANKEVRAYNGQVDVLQTRTGICSAVRLRGLSSRHADPAAKLLDYADQVVHRQVVYNLNDFRVLINQLESGNTDQVDPREIRRGTIRLLNELDGKLGRLKRLTEEFEHAAL